MRPIRLLLVFVVLCLTPGLASMPARAATNHIAAELVAPLEARPGDTVLVALRMSPESGWHGYWLNPGDAGLGLELKWLLPYGFSAGEPRYPVPGTLLVSGLMNHVYESEYAVLVPVRVSGDAQPGGVARLAVDARWLACSDTICVPEQGRLETDLRIGTAARDDPRFEAWQARLPAPLNAPARFAIAGNRLRLAIPIPASLKVDQPHFFPAADRVIAYAAPQAFRRLGDTLIVDMARPAVAAITPQRMTGVLRFNDEGDGVEIDAVPGPVSSGGTPLAATKGPELPALGWLLLAALAGGVLLNVMPCVFPILSLKALSLARAGESPSQARAEGLAYTAGVILACVGLGAVLLALRAAGQEVGWAFQLQDPLIVSALLLLAVAITTNLLGWYELAIPGFARAGSPQGAFATGLLAAFVATPCTGPFMAAAMGAALLLPVSEALALFAALGLGIALPFLAIAVIPGVRTRLPRPGAWMDRFRRWMALPMALTGLALLWLASRLGGWSFALAALALAVLLAGALAAVGVQQRKGISARVPALAALLIAIVPFTGLREAVGEPAATASRGLLPAQPFSQQALDKARAANKPVLAWFTADWCLTCKVNERVAIEREDVRDAFAKAGVVVLKGDWTRRDPAITRYLESQGAAGVPLYVWYPANGGAPRQLPQILTPDSLTSLVQP